MPSLPRRWSRNIGRDPWRDPCVLAPAPLSYASATKRTTRLADFHDSTAGRRQAPGKARLRAAGYVTDASAYAFPNSRGNRSTRQRIGAIVREAAAAATERLEGQGLPPLPETTPHTLRRTYISIALIANNFDVKWVMAQVGHADSKMTMDVYAQLEQRADRSHGTQFDALLRGAKHRLEGVDWATIGPRDRNGR